MVELLWPWLKAFAFTELIEAPIYWRFGRTSWTVGLAASAITHPFVWFAFPWLGERLELRWVVSATLSELFAWGVETVFVVVASPVRPARACLVALIANGASLGLGLLVRELTGLI